MAQIERTYRLLIVDDDATDRRFYHKLLTGQLHDVCEIRQAADGAAGLAALQAQVPDCVLLDFSLPDLTGLEFLVDAAVDGALPCAVVLVSGAGSEAIAVAAMQHGVQDYLVKDQVNARNLWQAITSAVARTELRQRIDLSLPELTAANAALQQAVEIHRATEADLRRAKDAAEQADAEKTRFVAMVTHELRTPLNGILGYAELLRIEEKLSARQEARVAAMLAAGRHLREMIEGVLDFAAAENGQVMLHPTPVALRDLTADCIDCVGPMATTRKLSLRQMTAHDAPRQIIADPARLRQVLLNLLGNAVKYTDAGSVELRMLPGAAQGGLRIEVVDTGRGIDAADRDRLFRDFERLDATDSTEGAGLGLAIAARTVGRMGGTIGHTPNHAGGSVFWLELPPGELAAPALPTIVAVTRPPLRLAEPLSSGQRVLLVDDIEMNHEVIGAFLRAAGHEVVLASSGRDAVRLAGEHAYDLVLMDLRMPGMDGLEATRRIRALDAPHGTVPILALTAATLRDQITRCREAGMNGHVAKPVDYATLTQAVASATGTPAARWTAEATIAASAEVRQPRAPEVAAPTPAQAATETPAQPRFDRAVLDQTLEFLSPVGAITQLQSLRDRQTQMLSLLDQPAEPALIAEAAHTLSSAAGMFGFAALSATARGFQQALAREAPEAEGLVTQMHVETTAALTMLDALMLECHVRAAQQAAQQTPQMVAQQRAA
jgi:signal transduction histidine kinase/HPt (histidine-containing phosphotransfer) domain-containing protein